MRILTRYLLRLHLAPFLFAATGLTLLLLLDQVSKRFEDLIGKGLHWTVIAEVFVFSIPFILAQTLPMAVLIAVLYVFSRLEGDFEVTAIKASGIPLSRVMAPLIVGGVLLTGGMTWFNDTILPKSNHHLQVLLTGIGRKKPTFYLRERTINEVLPSRLYVQPGAIDRENSTLDDVAIYDERGGEQSRTIYATSGQMGFAPDGEDLFLDLDTGVLQERPNTRPHGFQRIEFARMIMRVPDVANALERDTMRAFRSDREMTIAEMDEAAGRGADIVFAARTESHAYTRAITETLVAFEAPLETAAPRVTRVESDPAVGTEPAIDDPAAANPEARAGPQVDQPETERADAEPVANAAPVDSLARVGQDAALRFYGASDASNQFRAYKDRENTGLRQVNKYKVEIHKKRSIPAACIVFVLIGAPIAVRYPRGGVALVVGVSLLFFAAYYVSLVGGEELADRRFVSPFWAMWAPNVLFGVFGLVALARSTRVTR